MRQFAFGKLALGGLWRFARLEKQLSCCLRMTHELQSIPPVPRRVKWRAVLWHWWPVAFLGFVLGIYGGLITLMTFMAADGKPADDRLIDAGSHTVTGIVTKMEGGKLGKWGDEPVRISYDYTTLSDRQRSGRSFAEYPELKIGDPVQIEYSNRASHKSRVVGGHISLTPALHRFFFWTLLAPGLLFVTIWLLGVWQLRRMMRHGDIATADVMAIEPLRYVLPTMFRVVYGYRDHHATQRVVSHWVRARSVLGVRLLTHPKRIAVVHSRGGGGASRLVMADDFVVQQAGRDDPSHSRNP